MDIGKLTVTANNQSEESFSSSQVLEFVNDAIARINIECKANFPFMDLTSGNYEAFSESWQRTLFIPFVVGRMKQVDSSQFEYSDSFSEFVNNIALFKERYAIPEEYKDDTVRGSYSPDFTGNWWGWN